MDVIGLIIAVVVVAASVHDNAIGARLLDQVAGSGRGRVSTALVDQGFTNSVVEHGATLGIDVQVVARNPAQGGFVPEPIRWRVPNAEDGDYASCGPVFAAREVEQGTVAGREVGTVPLVRRSRRGRGPGPKRVAFEAALVHQMRCGDLRLFSGDERERNAAAYQAAASLPAPLSRGAARRYVVQALPRLADVTVAGIPLEPRAAADPE